MSTSDEAIESVSHDRSSLLFTIALQHPMQTVKCLNDNGIMKLDATMETKAWQKCSISTTYIQVNLLSSHLHTESPILSPSGFKKQTPTLDRSRDAAPKKYSLGSQSALRSASRSGRPGPEAVAQAFTTPPPKERKELPDSCIMTSSTI